MQLDAGPGRHRLRTMGLPGGQFFVAGAGRRGRSGAGGHARRLADRRTGVIARDAELTLENATDQNQLFILERTAWSDQAATAAEVTSLQLFRDLFANEALRPGERISVGTLTVLFTDLRESTRLYRENGDAVAFGHVMNHYDVLRAAIMRRGRRAGEDHRRRGDGGVPPARARAARRAAGPNGPWPPSPACSRCA